MTTLTSNDPSASSQPSTPNVGGLSLRVVQPRVDDQLLPLPLGKCTVGSSDRCQVHLADAQVRPLHCLIVLEGNEVTVTRWAPGAQLNGNDFATAPFQPGDCLQIGDVQLLLIADAGASEAPQSDNCSDNSAGATAVPEQYKQSDPQAQPQPQPKPPASSAINSAFASLSTPKASTLSSPASNTSEQSLLTESRESNNEHKVPSQSIATTTSVDPAIQVESDRLVSRLWTANYGARQRCRQLVGSLRAVRAEASSFDDRVSDLQQQLHTVLEEREQIFTQLSQLQEEAGEQESQSSAELDRLISELTTAYEKASTAEAAVQQQSELVTQLETELASLQGQREQWEQVRSSGELQRTKLAQALADREQNIETLQDELRQLREAADKADASRGEQTAALQALQVELEAVQTERDQLIATRDQSQQYQTEIEQALADSEQNLAVFQLELEKFQITSRQTDQELGESNAALQSMQAEFAQMAEERDQLRTKRTEYQLREQGWEHELSSRDSKIAELSEEIEELRATVADANQGVAAQVSQVEGIQQQLDALTTERDQLLVAQAEQVQKIQEWEEAVATRDRRIKELEDEHDGICEVLQSVEKGAFEQVDLCNKLQNQLATLREERDQLVTALPQQQEYIKQLEQALAERDGQITLLSEELTKTAQRQSELEAEVSAGTTAYHALEAELAELSTKCEELTAEQSTSDQSKAAVEQTLAEHQARVEQLEQQLESSQQERQELEQVVAEGSQSTETYQGQLEAWQAKHEQLAAEYRAETERRQQLDQQLVEQQQDVELFQVDLNSAKAELTRAVEQVTALQTERETLNQQLTGLREELASQEKIGDAEDSQLQQERDELAAELVALRQELETKQQTDSTGEPSEEAQQVIRQHEEEKALLQQQVEQHAEQSEQFTAELAQLRDELALSQANLQQAELGLKTAEQALQEQFAEHAVVDTQANEASDDVFADPTDDSLGNQSGVSEAVVEPCDEVPDYHDAYSSEELHEADEYSSEFSDSSVANDSSTDDTDDLVISESEPNAEAEAIDDVAVSSAKWAESFTADEDTDATPNEQADSSTGDASDKIEDSSVAEAEPVPNDEISGEEVAGDELPSDETPGHETLSDEVATFEEAADVDDNISPSDAPSGLLDQVTAVDEPAEGEVSESSPSGAIAYAQQSEEADEPKEEFKPPSFIDQYQHLLEDDGLASPEPVQSEPAPVVNKLAAEIDALESGGDADSDEADLEAYMQNMMRRMRGEVSEEETPTPQVSAEAAINQNPDPVAAVDEVRERVAAEEAAAQERLDAEPLDLEKLKRSSQKPQLPTDLSAMRDLANSSARGAIAKHHKRRHLEKALGFFLVCLIAIGVGGYLLLTAVTAQDYMSLSFIGGAIAVVVGAVGGLKLFSLLLLAIREGAWEKKASVKRAAD